MINKYKWNRKTSREIQSTPSLVAPPLKSGIPPVPTTQGRDGPVKAVIDVDMENEGFRDYQRTRHSHRHEKR